MGTPQLVSSSHTHLCLDDLQYGFIITKAAVNSHVYNKMDSFYFILYLVLMCVACGLSPNL